MSGGYSMHAAPLFGMNPIISEMGSSGDLQLIGQQQQQQQHCDQGITGVQVKLVPEQQKLHQSGDKHDTFMNPGAWNRTQSPIVTGTSVIGVVFKDGVMLAADCLGSYGSLARFRDERRLFPAGELTCLGVSGDISDMQYIQHSISQLLEEDFCVDDGHKYNCNNVYEYVSRMMYKRRSKMNPLWNSVVVAGVDESSGKRLLGCVDIHGTTWQSSTIATGFGAYLAQPLLRKAVEGKEATLTEAEATEIIDDCLRVLYYRDARSLNKYQRAIITKEGGVRITEPYSVSTNWSYASDIRGYGA